MRFDFFGTRDHGHGAGDARSDRTGGAPGKRALTQTLAPRRDNVGEPAGTPTLDGQHVDPPVKVNGVLLSATSTPDELRLFESTLPAPVLDRFRAAAAQGEHEVLLVVYDYLDEGVDLNGVYEPARRVAAAYIDYVAHERQREDALDARTSQPQPGDLALGDALPSGDEKALNGAIQGKIQRGSPAFAQLVANNDPNIAFKDEEGTGADRMMTPRLAEKLDILAALVMAEWPGYQLRVTEAWDEDLEHAGQSLHYEGRAADLTVCRIGSNTAAAGKLGRLARLAVIAGFGWVWYENTLHVHASVP